MPTNLFTEGNTIGLKHGHSPQGLRSPTYNSWHKMKSRCSRPNDPAFHNYGGRGVTVCERWLSFQNFLEDMGERPSKAHTLERQDNDGDYEPSNCRWVTKAEQSQNSRRTRLTWDAVKHIRDTGMKPKEIQTTYGVSVGTAYAVYQGKTWKNNE